MTRILCLLTALLLPASLLAADAHPEIHLWPKGAPGSEGKTEKELVVRSSTGEIQRVSQVHNPSITVYLPPKGKATGTAVLVIPGGGHRVLAIGHEGYNVAQKLSEDGIAAFILKYRLGREPNSTYKPEVHALMDTQRALRLIRSRAKEWGINPDHVGVVGFSAGGELAAWSSMHYDNGLPNPADDVDKQGCKPDFQGLIYPGSSSTIIPDKNSPPAFLACGYNDRKDISEGLVDVYRRFKQAKIPVELHIYANTGHGFGYRESNKGPAGMWIQRFEEWMVSQKMLGKP